MKIYPPCKGCGDRELGCHATCEGYKAYRAKVDAQKEAVLKEKAIDADAVAYMAERKRKREKGQGKK